MDSDVYSSKRRRLPKTGDVLWIKSDEAQCFIGHYVYHDPRRGPFMQFYSCPLSWRIEEGFSRCNPVLGPILVGINPPVREGRWLILGKIDPGDFTYPKFLMWTGKDGNYTWWIYDGHNETLLGSSVPEEYQSLENLAGWPYDLIEERLLTGLNPMSYASFYR